MRVYQNSTDDIVVECAEELIGKPIQLFSINGALIAERNIADMKTSIDMSGYSAGVYIVKVDNQSVKFAKR